MLPKSKLPYFIILIYSFSWISCTTTKKQNENNHLKEETTTRMEKDETQYKGQVVSESFINKGGKEFSNIQDLYFQIKDGERYFIKFDDSKINYSEAKELVGKNLLISATIKDGLWDVPDDNPQYAQSRGGLYMIILSYEVLD